MSNMSCMVLGALASRTVACVLCGGFVAGGGCLGQG